MEKIKVAKIRPISWKVVVQGREQGEYVRKALEKLELETTECVKEPGLVEPPLYSFIATPAAESPMTSKELEAALEEDDQIELMTED